MKRLVRSHVAWLALALAVPALSGCKDEKLEGTYTATTFTYANAGAAAKDVLAAGGSITLVIAHDLSTSGSMSIPASVTGSSSFNVGLLGNAAQSGDMVELNLVQDSFLRDITFAFDGNSLSGSGTFQGVTVVVTLSK
jgi:hypothetical protein